MNKDCKIVTEGCEEIFNWINLQDEVGEESITDWLLYHISKQSPNIYYKLFSKIKEARVTGADFEFWILNKTKSLKTRIQAKRLRKGKDHYASILYSNKHGLQIDKLISNSVANKARPFYAFYNNENEQTKCGRNITNEGVYIVCANELNRDIVNKPRKKVYTKDLISKSIALSCWFCCPLCQRNMNDSIEEFLNTYYTFDGLDNSGITENIPNYISEFISTMKEYEEERFEAWEREYQSQLNGVKGIWVIDNRK